MEDLALLLRLNKSWYAGIPADELYEITRAWWVMSAANAQRVVRVLAVAGGIVREVYEPTEWLPSPVEGLENRIGFNGVVAGDREMYVGRDVAHLFRPGSANPVRYLPLDALLTEPVDSAGFRRADCRDAGGDSSPARLSSQASSNVCCRFSTPSSMTCCGHSRGPGKSCSTPTPSPGCSRTSPVPLFPCSTSSARRGTGV